MMPKYFTYKLFAASRNEIRVTMSVCADLKRFLTYNVDILGSPEKRFDGIDIAGFIPRLLNL